VALHRDKKIVWDLDNCHPMGYNTAVSVASFVDATEWRYDHE